AEELRTALIEHDMDGLLREIELDRANGLLGKARLDALEWGVRGARRRPVVCVAGPGWAGRQPPGARHLSGLSDAVDTLATL
ncbi:hypothetical protein ABZ943_12535, partial [Streptomyces rubiginosohelvolus]